jgi:DNA-binding transcriptional MerR regulator
VEAQTLQRSRGPSAGGRPPQATEPAPDALAEAPRRPRKSLTIGAVCRLLESEFADISISKIRYLEDQKLISPRRTPGGYRLYSPADVSRLRTILRLQRDEFLPLRVIRQELAAGRSEQDDRSGADPDEPRATRPTRLSQGPFRSYLLQEMVEYTGVDERLVRELEEYGVIKGQVRDGVRCYDDLEREIVRAVGELTRFGVAARNLRVFRTSADREAALLEQILGAALRSRNSERRNEAIESLENLAAVVSHLKHLLLVRDLRALL